MFERGPLKVFISYSGKDREVWEPLGQCLQDMYSCEIKWAVTQAPDYSSVFDLEQNMVRQSDVGIFLLTSFAKGVVRELRYWKAYHGSFQNTLLLVGTSLDLDEIKRELEFELPPHLRLNPVNPWSDIGRIFPVIHKKVTQVTVAPGWRQRLSNFANLHSADLQNKGFTGKELFHLLEPLTQTRSYESWRFVVNWPLAELYPRMDAYSKEIDCQDLLEVLIKSIAPITHYEITSVFETLKKLALTNSRPPQKVSGAILFGQSSKATLDYVQTVLESHLYERSSERAPSTGSTFSSELLGNPSDLLPPSELLSQAENLRALVSAQRKILKVASDICKYILCSTYQIVLSCRIPLQDAGQSEQLIACTATSTNKEQLAAFADIPVLHVGDAGTIMRWYGQPYRYPTSECRAHAYYHVINTNKRGREDLIVHLHPKKLLDFYEDLTNKYNQHVPFEILEQAQYIAEQAGVRLTPFKEYQRYSARHPEFGKFLVACRTPGNLNDTAWKPNHGVWLLCDNSQDDLQILAEVEKIQDVARKVREAILK